MGLSNASWHAARPGRAIRIAVIAAALAMPAGCVATRPDIDGPTPPPEFPVGTFAKEIQDPSLGRMQINWTFDPSGQWAEIPIALDDQAIRAMVVRGTYTVEGESVTIASDYPPGIGTSRHAWRLEGNRLWTTFESSDNEDDAEWFAMLDPTPWIRQP